MSVTLTSVRPMVAVPRLDPVLDFYADRLGFSVEGTFGNPPTWCALRRGAVELMFTTLGGERAPVDRSGDGRVIYIDTNDATALRREFIDRGATCGDLRTTVYGMLEFEIHNLVGATMPAPERSPAEQPIVLYCGTGGRSALAAQCLESMGYTNVRSMAGGLVAWAAAHLPIDTPA